MCNNVDDNPVDPSIVWTKTIDDLLEFMAAHGWDIKIEATLKGWGGEPGVSVWCNRWKWHGRPMGYAVSIHGGTQYFNELDCLIKKTAEKALQAYIDFPDIPPRQLVDGSLRIDDAENWRRNQEHVEEIKKEMDRLKHSGEVDIRIEEVKAQEKKKADGYVVNESLLPALILDVESKPYEYQKEAYIHGGFNFVCRTEDRAVSVPFWIMKETTHGFYIYIKVPANTDKIYVYPVI
jgi:hypothetical protein